MKLINYALQTQIEQLSDTKSKKYFKDYIKTILEDETKPYYQKADYVGLSLQELKQKCELIAKDIKELQALKKRYAESLEIAKELTADVFIKNGVDRIDGNIISSLTISKPTSKTVQTLNILNKEIVMQLGYVKFEPDIEAIEKAMKTEDGLKELDKFVTISSDTTTTTSKVKINTKKAPVNINVQTDEILVSKQLVA